MKLRGGFPDAEIVKAFFNKRRRASSHADDTPEPKTKSNRNVAAGQETVANRNTARVLRPRNAKGKAVKKESPKVEVTPKAEFLVVDSSRELSPHLMSSMEHAELEKVCKRFGSGWEDIGKVPEKYRKGFVRWQHSVNAGKD